MAHPHGRREGATAVPTVPWGASDSKGLPRTGPGRPGARARGGGRISGGRKGLTSLREYTTQSVSVSYTHSRTSRAETSLSCHFVSSCMQTICSAGRIAGPHNHRHRRPHRQMSNMIREAKSLFVVSQSQSQRPKARPKAKANQSLRPIPHPHPSQRQRLQPIPSQSEEKCLKISQTKTFAYNKIK